jgi:hypothetical protein
LRNKDKYSIKTFTSKIKRKPSAKDYKKNDRNHKCKHNPRNLNGRNVLKTRRKPSSNNTKSKMA